MRSILIFFLLIFFFGRANGQDSLIDKELDEVIIFSNKFAERKKNVVQKIDVVTARQIAAANAQNTGDLLTNTGNVFVQKSQQGGSSPVIRGFEASRVLLVIDGIRMNNAIYRSGHLQNVITVDQNMLERIEVLYGPSSTIYGSDALGGVVHMRTKIPALSSSAKNKITGSALTRYSSANQEKTAHFDISIGGRKFGWLQSYNFSDFDDMRAGNRALQGTYIFLRPTYVTSINGIDSIVNNEDERVQKFSGYSQWDITQKFLYKPNNRLSHLLNLQYSNSSDVPRYDRLQDMRNGRLRYAEWYYGPQLRQLAAYEMNAEETGYFNSIKAILSYQHIEESRHQREYRRYDRLDNRFEKLNVAALTLDARKMYGAHEITLGADGQWNDVRSTAHREDMQTGAVSPLDTRYPNGKNRMSYQGVYAQHIFKWGMGKWVLNDGIRLQSTNMRSTIADNSIFNFPFTEISQDHKALTGNIGIVYMPRTALRFTLGLSSGFRSPNIDDAAKIFESNTASAQLIVPNENIRPERTYNADLGFGYSGEKLKMEASGFYTRFTNAIALAPFRFNGQDSITYNGSRVRVFANQNINEAYLYGFHASIQVDPHKRVRIHSTLNYTHGRLRQPGKQEVPLDHIPPVYGKTSARYATAKFQVEAYALYNGWKKIADYHPSGEDNAQYATKDGTPPWTTVNLKTAWQVSSLFSLQAGLENIFDRNYRHFGSGFTSAGRNLVLALRAAF